MSSAVPASALPPITPHPATTLVNRVSAASTASDDASATEFFDAPSTLTPLPLPPVPTTMPPASAVRLLGPAAEAPADSELVACLHMHQGILVGAFVLDLPKIRSRLYASAADAVRVTGLSVQEVARQSVLATGTLIAQSAATAQTLAKQAAWSTGEACVLGAWNLGTWPMRTMYRAVVGP